MIPESKGNESDRYVVDLCLPKSEFIKEDRLVSFKDLFAFMGKKLCVWRRP